jgi:hypothetical protein
MANGSFGSMTIDAAKGAVGTFEALSPNCYPGRKGEPQ